MDRKIESEVQTLLRIEVLFGQGLLRGLSLAALGVLLIPFVPFVWTSERWRAARGMIGRIRRAMFILPWFVIGIVFAVFAPFGMFAKAMADTIEIVRAEWKGRGIIGSPKTPDGKPLVIRSAEDKAKLDAAIRETVIEDYNEEAKEYGEGIDI